MTVFKKAAMMLSVLLICLLLCACSRVVRGPSDELCMYRWGSQLDNGNVIELIFDDDKAALSVRNDSFELNVSGIFFIDDENLIISDAATQMNYGFTYLLHGDSVELTYGGGTVILDKK